jgi:hypothetical protein
MIEKVLEKLGASVRDDGTGVYALPRVGSGYWMDNSVDDDALLEKECQLYLREKGCWHLENWDEDDQQILKLEFRHGNFVAPYAADTLLECYMKAVMES